MTKTLAIAGLISAALVGSAAFAQHDTKPSTVNQPVHKASPHPLACQDSPPRRTAEQRR